MRTGNEFGFVTLSVTAPHPRHRGRDRCSWTRRRRRSSGTRQSQPLRNRCHFARAPSSEEDAGGGECRDRGQGEEQFASSLIVTKGSSLPQVGCPDVQGTVPLLSSGTTPSLTPVRGEMGFAGQKLVSISQCAAGEQHRARQPDRRGGVQRAAGPFQAAVAFARTTRRSDEARVKVPRGGGRVAPIAVH